MAKTFKASELVGKTLYNKRPVLFYRSLNQKGTRIKTGQRLGPIYSWVEKGSDLYWMFYDEKKKPWYIKHEEGAFDTQSLKDQGVKTEKEKEEEQNQSKFDIYFKKYGIPVLVGAGLLIIITKNK